MAPSQRRRGFLKGTSSTVSRNEAQLDSFPTLRRSAAEVRCDIPFALLQLLTNSVIDLTSRFSFPTESESAPKDVEGVCLTVALPSSTSADQTLLQDRQQRLQDAAVSPQLVSAHCSNGCIYVLTGCVPARRILEYRSSMAPPHHILRCT